MADLFRNAFTKYWCYVINQPEEIPGVWDFTNGLQVEGCNVITTCNITDYIPSTSNAVLTTNINQNIDGVKTFLNPLIVPNAVSNNQAVNLGQLNAAIPPSGNYIDNQSSLSQSANFWINGTGVIETQLNVGKVLTNIFGYALGSYYAPITTAGLYSNGNFYTNFSPGANTSAFINGVSSTIVSGAGSWTYNNPLTGFYSYFINQASSIVDQVNGLWVASPFFHNTGSINGINGVNIDPQGIYGVTGAYGINQKGTNDLNYFAGNVGIGTNSPSSSFQINQSTTGVGTVSITSGSTTVTGYGTQFLNTFKIGDTITIAGETRTIASISSNTSLTTTATWGVNSYLLIPTLTGLSLSNGGGGFASTGTYYYKVVAGNGAGTTVVSNELSINVTSLTDVVTLDWTAIPGFTLMYIWRGTTSGGQNTYFTTTNYQTFIDTGTVGISGTPPVSNTALGQAGYTLTGGAIAQFFGNGNIAFPRLQSGTAISGGYLAVNSSGVIILATGGTSSGGTITSVSGVPANGFTWSIATSTTTPAITLTLQNATTSQSGQLTSTDWNIFNSKQPQLSGTGFIKASGTSISYDNSTYLTTSIAASTYQTISNLETTLTNSTTLYPSGSAVVAAIAAAESSYVPYTGATGAVTLGSFGFTSNGLTNSSTSFIWQNPNVQTSIGTYSDVLIFNPSTGTQIGVITATNFINNFISGTTNSLAKFTGTNVIGNAVAGTDYQAAITLTQYSVPISTGTNLTQDNSNFYYNYSTHLLSVAVGGDFSGSNSINIYGQYDSYEPQGSIGTITNGLTTPGISASTSRGTGASPVINNTGDLIGTHSFWAYTGSTAAYTYMAGIAGTTVGTTANNLGGQLDFYIKANNSSSVTSALTIFNNNSIQFNTGYSTGLIHSSSVGLLTSSLVAIADLSATGTPSSTTYLRGDNTWATISGSGGTAANPTAVVGLTAVNGVATTYLRSDGAPPLSQSIIPVWTGLHTFQTNGIGTTSTDGLVIQNSTASTSGTPNQYTGRIRFNTHVWNTTATAADNQIDIIEEVRPISSATPIAKLFWAARESVSGTGAFTDLMSVDNSGNLNLIIGNQIVTTGNISISSGNLTVATGVYSSVVGKAGFAMNGSNYGIIGNVTGNLWSLGNNVGGVNNTFTSTLSWNLNNILINTITDNSVSGDRLQVAGNIISGVAGSILGTIKLAGSTSGTISIIPQVGAGTYNFNLPTTAGTAGQLLTSQGGSSTAMIWSSILTKPHNISIPTTGGTVNLTNNQYNIINPSGALLALTINLPSSPSNNDCVYIKFTQNITTVTYGNGTVVDGITAPTAGGLTVLVYDSGTTSWY